MDRTDRSHPIGGEERATKEARAREIVSVSVWENEKGPFCTGKIESGTKRGELRVQGYR